MCPNSIPPTPTPKRRKQQVAGTDREKSHDSPLENKKRLFIFHPPLILLMLQKYQVRLVGKNIPLFKYQVLWYIPWVLWPDFWTINSIVGYINLGRGEDLSECGERSVEAMQRRACEVLDEAWRLGIRYYASRRINAGTQNLRLACHRNSRTENIETDVIDVHEWPNMMTMVQIREGNRSNVLCFPFCRAFAGYLRGFEGLVKYQNLYLNCKDDFMERPKIRLMIYFRGSGEESLSLCWLIYPYVKWKASLPKLWFVIVYDSIYIYIYIYIYLYLLKKIYIYTYRVIQIW